MKRVHVTGANGFIGREVIARLREAGYAVTGSDLRASPDVRALDLRDRAAVVALMGELAPDIVMHGGAISGAMLATDDPALMFDVNVMGTLNIVEAMRRTGTARLVFLSSNAVYAEADTRDPVPEDAPCGAADAYGASKLAAESVLRAYAASFGIGVVALRISSVFGAERVTPYLISQTLDAVRNGAPIEVTDTRSNMRQFVHVSDAARAVCLAVAAVREGFTPVNITGGTYLSEEQVVRLLLAGLPAPALSVIADRGRHDDGRVGPLDISRAAALLGYAPSVDIAEALTALARPIVPAITPTS
ncbi:NAD-dependent epimerase/dehydratase family protein [Ancylobacter sp. SL191]|uniref:NAD-dependent epimerase/dehydratase family protein n=1 Tax=Ancylobacter sp. SL191 TaxID=2995166 RepID=UPI0022719777|nr:NAD(P)-dependent oxidoreductase [Ancylobacter sp. SL191]WAC27703.1 NAD(P)-dependent oxidoreductase [Ancylobacter sp. SL191]